MRIRATVVVSCALLAGCGSHPGGPTDASRPDAPTEAGRPDAPTNTGLPDASSDASTAAAVDPTKLVPSCFHGGDAPILHYDTQTTSESLFAGATWNDPSVIKVNGQFIMYASSNHNFSGPVEIYRMVSNDGDHFVLSPKTPVLVEGASGAWDAGGVETPAIVRFGGKYHLFYTGYQPPYGSEGATDFRIGDATSSDGISWTKSPSYVLAPTGNMNDFDGVVVAEPGPVVVNNQIYLYFTAIGVDQTLGKGLQTIGVVKSSDGVTWGTPVRAFAPDQTTYPRSANWVGFSTPNAIVIAGQVHVFTDVANDFGTNNWTQVQLHHAWSADGVSGFVQDVAPIRKNSDFSWTARSIRSPAVLLDGTTLHLWFAGDNTPTDWTTFGIGHMTCDLSR